MNYLLGKLRGNNSTLWKILATENTLYPTPDLSSTHKFDAAYKLDENEWYQIEKFSELGYRNVLVETAPSINTANYNQLSRTDFAKLHYVGSIQDSFIIFQKVTASQIVKKRWISISDAPSLHENEPIIVLSNSVDAVYNPESNILYFRDLGRIKDIFIGIEAIYREATQEEVNRFCTDGFVSLGDGYTAKDIKALNRKRIAQIKDKLDRLPADKKQQLIQYAQNYVTDLKFTNEKFVVESENQLKNLLYAIDERFYKTEISGKTRLANSVKDWTL